MDRHLDINRDDIVFEGKKLLRPDHIPRSEWIKFWERFQDWYYGMERERSRHRNRR